MEYWAYAREHAEEIQGAVVEVTAQFEETMETRFIEKGVASSRAANKLVFESLELLERWRNLDET